MLKTKYPRVLSSSTICSDHVKNSAGEDLGKIEDLMIDLDSGRTLMQFSRLAAFSRWATSSSPFLGKR